MRFAGRATMVSVSLLLLVSRAGAVEPFSFDAAPGRLSKDVVPTDYTLALTPDLDAHSVQGNESVTLTVRKAVETISFNSLNQRLDHVTLYGHPVRSVESDDAHQMTTVTLAAQIKPGVHKLAFTYTGKIESNPFGLYTQPYKTPDGRAGRLLSTKFEATDARRMFPCWDEPAFRATFQLSLTGPKDWTVISNMPVFKRMVKGDMATVLFQRTPRMPTYLVEMTAGDFAEVSAAVGTTRLGIWAVRGQEAGGREALENAKTILADYNDYFGYPYPLPKLDSIATPGGFTGAMENWGAITYNDQILLITSASTLSDRQAVFSVQAHEMAHQWNGDLVTMGWWDDLWLNESFASWRAAKETEERHPEWKWWEREDGRKEDAMTADARVTSHAIQVHVTNELEARSAFDPQITYAKGEAVLRMLEAYIGADRFRDGIRAYMKARAFSNATSADLWLALDASGAGSKVSEVAASWTEQAGYPLVTAAAKCDAQGNRTLMLSQGRFLLRGEDAAHPLWRVPLQVRIGSGAPQSVLLDQAEQSVPAGRCDEAVSLDAGAVGFFRAAYDDATLETDRRAFSTLPSGDRIALLDDQWALVEAGRRQLGGYLPLAEALGGEPQERAWSQILDALTTLEKDERGTPGHDAFVAYARKLLQPLAQRLGWETRMDETPATQDLRRKVLGRLGKWGDPDTLAEARRRFERFAADPASLAPDDQAFVLGAVGAHADQPTFERLHDIARAAHSETELRRDLTALMQVQDPALAQAAADIALSSEIPAQAGAVRFRLIAQLADYHPALAWSVFSAHVDQLMEPYPQYRPLILAQSVPEIFWNAQSPEELEAWLKPLIPEPMLPNLARGLEATRFLRSEKAMLVPEADAYVGGHS
jgi:aminopeptidase N